MVRPRAKYAAAIAALVAANRVIGAQRNPRFGSQRRAYQLQKTPSAIGETINELSVAIDRGLTVSELASTIHVYPTFGFAVQQLAAEAAFEAATSGTRGRVTRALRHLS